MQWLVTVVVQLGGKYDLPPMTYRIIASNPAVAARKAYTIYKRQPALARKRLDHFRFRIVRAGAVPDSTNA